MKVRTRFAPSPTGFLHVGSLRTALYSWLYARHHQGEFLLRIEDTDHERSTPESVQTILDGLSWCGLTHDGEVIYQTDRYARYQAVADDLLKQGLAYRCTCSKERLEALRESAMANKEKPRYDGCCRDKNIMDTSLPYVLRFKTPMTGQVSFEDQVYGIIEVNNEELDDLILVRSDGHPTYNFAVVVDDWDMAITHVIRGDDHLNNTPRQIHLYQAFGAPIPVFAHLPMILGEDGKKLSKRHGAVSVLQFKTEGVLPEALLNYIVRLGWSCGDQEIFSSTEMIELFDLNQISKGGAGFDYQKLFWLNQHYMKSLPPETIAMLLKPFYAERGIDVVDEAQLLAVVKLMVDRAHHLVELCDKSLYFFQDSISYDEDAVKKHLRPVVYEPLKQLAEVLKSASSWNSASIHDMIDSVCQAFEMNMGKVGQPLRVAVTGGSQSPGIDETIALIGQERTLKRLGHALSVIETRMATSSS